MTRMRTRPRMLRGGGEIMRTLLAAAVSLALLAVSLPGAALAQGDDIPLPAPNTSPRGLWSDGVTLWVADWGQAQKLYAYSLDDGTPQPGRNVDLAGGNASPWGIWSNGATLWVTDSQDGRLYAYDLATAPGRPQRDKDIVLDPGNAHPVGLWSDGTTVWVADWGTRQKLYAYSLQGGASQASRAKRVTRGRRASRASRARMALTPRSAICARRSIY